MEQTEGGRDVEGVEGWVGWRGRIMCWVGLRYMLYVGRITLLSLDPSLQFFSYPLSMFFLILISTPLS